jgi:hypothetical protein
MYVPPVPPGLKSDRRAVGPQLTPPTPEDLQAQRDRMICRELFLIRGTLWLVMAVIMVCWDNPMPLLLVPPCLLVAIIMLAWPRP